MAAPNSSSPPPRQPSPAKSFRSRVGTMLRRNSAINAMRPASPFRSESRASLKADASAQVSETVTRPRASSTSAIASPALSTSPPSHSHIGPSPLAKEATQPSPAPPLVPLAPEPESKPPTVAAPPQIPPAVEAVVEPPKAAEEPPAPAQEAQVPPKPPVVEEAPVPSTQPEPEEIPSVSDLAPVLLASPPRTPEVKPTVIQERPADIFAWGDDLRPSKKSSLSSIPARAATPEPPKPETAASSVFEITQTESPQKAEEHNHLAPETLVWRDSPESHTISPKGSIPSLAKESTRQEPLVASPQSIPQDLSRKDSSKSSLASSYGQVLISAPGRRVSVSVDPSSSHGYESLRGRSRASSVRVSIDDNNADPFTDRTRSSMPIPKHVLSPIISAVEPPPSAIVFSSQLPLTESSESSGFTPSPMPITLPAPLHEGISKAPQPALAERTPGPMMPEPSIEHSIYQQHTPSPVVMSLPLASTLVENSRSIREMPSGYSIGGDSTTGQTIQDTDERRPLLPRGQEPSSSKSPAQPNGPSAISFPISQPAWPTNHSLHSRGWTEHILPDSTFYYSHPERCVTTDIDLRHSKNLEAIAEYLNRKFPSEITFAYPGWELWIRDGGKLKNDFSPVPNWVNHKAKIVTLEAPPSNIEEINTFLGTFSDDDRLDMEYRYWAFLEAHPAHSSLPLNAHSEAMDALSWSYTDCLLPSQQPAPPPFAPQECQELMGLLQSFQKESSRSSTLVHTRVVARVLLRVVQWRQHYFRPNRPLPRDMTKGPTRLERRMPFRRFFLDIIMGLFCLGIPYLFVDRSQHHRLDEESGLRSPGPMLMIGGCACLVAAVILSASVTFLSLPGLDDISRLAGLIAILFSASSMISTVVALFRYKADVERTVMYVGGEGLMVVSRRSIIMSLPLVFLAWAIAAFITGITFYSFKGATLRSGTVVKEPFVDYTHWAMVGTLGGLAGVMLMTALLARR